MKPLNITVCGGGSLGHVCIGVFSANGASINLLTGHPDKWKNDITVTDPDGKIYAGHLNRISANPHDVIPQADIVLICQPGYLIRGTLADIKPYLKQGAAVGSIVSSTGFFFMAHEVLGSDVTIFGFQRVPFIARVDNYGSSALLLGYKPSVNIAIENSYSPESLREAIEALTATPVNLLDSFYEAALTNSNPILHTGRLYSMWQNPEPTGQQIKFYADWTEEASKILIDMDREFMSVLDALGVRKGAIQPLLEYYESSDAASLTEKIKSIPAFKPIMAPMIETEKGWMPDLGSRYFTEDFPFGLRFIKELADKLNLSTPVINKVYEWGMSKIK